MQHADANLREGRRWLEQAERDLESARLLLQGQLYDTCCFHGHQAAEKALKAFLYTKGYRSLLTHSTLLLLQTCGAEDASFTELEAAARELDRHYIGARYPNFYPESTPARYYTREMAEQCLKLAASVLQKVKPSLAS